MQPEDMGLLVALNALLEEQSVTRAAERTHVSTPTMSRTLGRLRRITGDPLLVRAGRSFVPTEHALAIAPDVRSAVDLGVSVFRAPGTVDSSQLDRVFTLRASDAFIGSFGGRLVAHLQARAPLVSIRFVGEGTESTAELRDGHVDLDLGAVHELDDGLESDVLRIEFLSGIVRSGHPLTKGKVTARRICAFGHLAVSRRGRGHGPVDDQLGQLGLERRVVATVPDFYPALAIVSSTDLVTFAPTAIVDMGRIAGLSIIPTPFDLPPIEVAQTWHRRYTHDPAHQWLRTSVREVCAT
jgi:DNA-binding transcriptional LysR family regulator